MRPPSRAAAWSVALCATLAMTVSYVDRQTMAAIAPALTTALGIDETHYGWLTSAFSLTYLLGAPLAGMVVDRAGARRGLPVALLLWSLVAALHAAVPGFVALFALRVALGAAESPSFPGAAQSVRRVLPAKERAAGVGLIFTGSSIGGALVAPLAVRLNATYGWRSAFLGTALLGAAWIPLWLLVTRPPGVRALLDGPAEAPGALGAGPPSPPRASFGALFSDPAVLRAFVLILTSAPTLMVLFNWGAKYLVALGERQDALGAYLWAPPLALDAGAIGFGVLCSRRDRVAPAGEPGERRDLILIAAACVVALTLGPWVRLPVAATALFCVAAFGTGGIYSMATSDMLARVGAHRASTAGGITAAAQSLAHIVTGPLVGHVLDRTHRYGPLLAALGLLVIPGALAWVAWPMAAGTERCEGGAGAPAPGE